MCEMSEYTADELMAILPLPAQDANKYSRGKLVALVGSVRYPGAACLVALASQRMGAGYTEVVTAPQAIDQVRSTSPSLVVRSWKGLQPADFPATRSGRPCACAVGSGFDAGEPQSARLVQVVLKQTHAPVLVDGGALDVLATKEGRRLLRRRFIRGLPTVVTPHLGEAARLAAPFNMPVDNAAELACNLAGAYGVITLLKGPETFISDGERIVRMADGSPALAKAGTGDVLAGMAGALLAQGMDALDACVLAATLHARAGCLASDDLTSICVTAEDVIDRIPAAIKSLVQNAHLA